MYSSSQGCHTATGTHMPHGITQCYLPPGRGDIPALTPAEAGTRLSDPEGMQGWVDLVGLLHTEMVYPPVHSTNAANDYATPPTNLQLLIRTCLAHAPSAVYPWVHGLQVAVCLTNRCSFSTYLRHLSEIYTAVLLTGTTGALALDVCHFFSSGISQMLRTHQRLVPTEYRQVRTPATEWSSHLHLAEFMLSAYMCQRVSGSLAALTFGSVESSMSALEEHKRPTVAHWK